MKTRIHYAMNVGNRRFSWGELRHTKCIRRFESTNASKRIDNECLQQILSQSRTVQIGDYRSSIGECLLPQLKKY
jgi:hypothetical protein